MYQVISFQDLNSLAETLNLLNHVQVIHVAGKEALILVPEISDVGTNLTVSFREPDGFHQIETTVTKKDGTVINEKKAYDKQGNEKPPKEKGIINAG